MKREKKRKHLNKAGWTFGFFLVLAVVSVFWNAAPVLAVDYEYFVDGTGNDDINDGSFALPWRTLNRAFTVIQGLNYFPAVDSIVVHVGAGTYSVGNGEVDSVSIYEITKPNMTIKGLGSGASIIDGSGASSWYSGLLIYTDNITVAELDFKGFSSSGVSVGTGDNVKILNCQFDNNGYGVFLSGSNAVTAPIVTGNGIFKSGSAGIYITNSGAYDYSPLIKANKLYDNPAGIVVGSNGYSGVTIAPKIRNNLIVIAGAGAANSSEGIVITTSMGDHLNPEIIHNTIDGGGIGGTGINIGFSSFVNPVIRYNIVTNFIHYGISQDINITSTLDIDYNDSFQNGATASDNYYNVVAPGIHNVSVDPHYAISGDFSIESDSPCIDAIPPAEESTLSIPVMDDFVGTSRPRASELYIGRNYDIGCYEYPYQEFTFTLPGGTGLVTDYRLLTIPLNGILGATFLENFEQTFGVYDPEKCRVFAYVQGTEPAEYKEINDPFFIEYFSTHDFHGSAFWVISRTGAFEKYSQVINGYLPFNKRNYKIQLMTGWNLISLPWADSTENEAIHLANLTVEDGDSRFSLLDGANDLTQQAVWAYGSSGYTRLEAPTDILDFGRGYWIYSNMTGVNLIVPPENLVDFGVFKKKRKTPAKEIMKNVDILTPPMPPGSGLKAEGGNGCFIDSAMFQ